MRHCAFMSIIFSVREVDGGGSFHHPFPILLDWTRSSATSISVFGFFQSPCSVPIVEPTATGIRISAFQFSNQFATKYTTATFLPSLQYLLYTEWVYASSTQNQKEQIKQRTPPHTHTHTQFCKSFDNTKFLLDKINNPLVNADKSK